MTAPDAREVLYRHLSLDETETVLARRFTVSQTAISSIVLGRTYEEHWQEYWAWRRARGAEQTNAAGVQVPAA